MSGNNGLQGKSFTFAEMSGTLEIGRAYNEIAVQIDLNLLLCLHDT